MIKHLKITFFLTIAGIACILCTCIFDNQNPQTPLVMTYVGNGTDTLSPLAKLTFAFSSPVTSSVDFSFFPSNGQLYTVTLNPSRDTVTLSFLEMLQGNTRYVAKLAATVTGSAGSLLSPGNDSVVFYTAFAEHEPNSNRFLADTIRSFDTYGIISPASDTDYYVLTAYVFFPVRPRIPLQSSTICKQPYLFLNTDLKSIRLRCRIALSIRFISLFFLQ